MAKARNSTQASTHPRTAVEDVPDLRDWPFEPSLSPLPSRMDPPGGLHILDQKHEGACTGFGLAAAINLLNKRRGNQRRVSARMLYEMAKRHDEWPGEAYAGSSCRGAVKGWYNMGVCRETKWRYAPGKPGELTVARAKDARSTTIGAYYRVQPRISDFHAALSEGRVVFCSATTHAGWDRPDRRSGLIPFYQEPAGGHAFAVVGYDARGFWIQNSWGKRWGRGGLALWQYEDWLRNVMDAWVLNLALPTPQIWHLPAAADVNRSGTAQAASPARSEIAGHFAHVDDGHFRNQGRYWSTADDVLQTARLVAASPTRYPHLLLYAHGGLNSPKASARRIAQLKETFKANGIYPYHFMYDTGLAEELKDVILRREAQTAERAGGFSDWTDRLLEWAARVPGRALWREMKAGARLPFLPGRAGSTALQFFLDEFARAGGAGLRVHLCGHSTGAILLAHLLETMEQLAPGLRIATCSLFAPAASVDLFERLYYPYLIAPDDAFGIDRMRVFNLSDRRERDDDVASVYRKSLLYLVSNAFEEDRPEALLGMQRYAEPLMRKRKMQAPELNFSVHYSDGDNDEVTASRSHGGFDNDAATMNTLLGTIVGREPDHRFTAELLEY